MKKCRSEKTSGPELSFYDYLYAEQFNYEEFKKNAFIRLKILRKIENGIFEFSSLKTHEDDNITHFCLKLICAQTRWTIKWFVNLETQLLKHRLEKNISDARQFFNDQIWPHLSIKNCLDNSTTYEPSYINQEKIQGNLLFHFTCCSDILAKRTHQIHNGFFEKTDDVLISFITETFRKACERYMNELYDKVVIDSDERLIKLNKELFPSAVDGSSTEKVSGDLLQMSIYFPLCVKGIMDKLKVQKHLKYTDRLMLCLFLKDIGMSLNDTIAFFKSHFKCTIEQFNKEYLYNIRHSYGLEGKRANYPSFSCMRVIGYSNDISCFGCPFVNNHNFVKLNSDIEDLDRDAIRCCASVGAKIIGKEFEKIHISPAEYFRTIAKEKPFEKLE